MAAVLLPKSFFIFCIVLLCSRKSVSWNVEIIEDTDTAWNASDLIYGPEANHDNGGAKFEDKTRDPLDTSVTSFESSNKTSRTGKKSGDDDLIDFESDQFNQFFQGILKDEGMNNDELETSVKDGIFVLIDGDYDFGVENGSNFVNDSNEAVVVQDQQSEKLPESTTTFSGSTLPISSKFETNLEITSWTPEDSSQSTGKTESAYGDQINSSTITQNLETSADDETTIAITDASESPTEVPTTASTTSISTVASATSTPDVFSSATTSRLPGTATVSSVPTTSVSSISTTSLPTSKTPMTTFRTETTSVPTTLVTTQVPAIHTSAELPTFPLDEPSTFKPEFAGSPVSTASTSVPFPAATSTTAAPQTVVIHNHHYHFHFPDEDHEAVIQVADTSKTSVPTPQNLSPANILSTTPKTSLPAPNLSPENQKAWNQTIEALLNQQQKTRRSRMLRSRTSSFGPGIRRRQTVHSCQLRNLSKAKGTGQVVVYKIVRQNSNNVKLVKNMRKKPIKVFPIKRIIGPKAFKRQTKWKVVPQWKIDALKQAGFNITYGKVERCRLKAKPAGRPTTPTPPVDATAFAILLPNSPSKKNTFVKAVQGRSLSDDSDKLRFKALRQSRRTSEAPLYKLGDLDLKLKNRLLP